MALQLTPDQEERVRAIVREGFYASVEEAIAAGLAAVEAASLPKFQGSDEELRDLLREGLDSPERNGEEFWRLVDRSIESPSAPRSIE